MPNPEIAPDPEPLAEQDALLGTSRLRSARWGWIFAYGALVILIGILALANPLATWLATGVLFGLMLLLFGVAAVASGLSSLSQRARWIEIALGALAVIVGLVVLFNPFAGALSLVWAIGAWLLVAGIFQIVGAIRVAQDRGWRLFLGIVDTLLGALLLFGGPAVGAVYLAIAVGLSFLIRGVFLIFLALAVRKLAQA